MRFGSSSLSEMAMSLVWLRLSHAVDATVSWGHQGHDEQRAAAIIGAQLGYASLKNALARAVKSEH